MSNVDAIKPRKADLSHLVSPRRLGSQQSRCNSARSSHSGTDRADDEIAPTRLSVVVPLCTRSHSDLLHELDARLDAAPGGRTVSNMGLEFLPDGLRSPSKLSRSPAAARKDGAAPSLSAGVEESGSQKHQLSLETINKAFPKCRRVEWDSFTSLRHIGSGAFCDVLLAKLDGERVAVKVLQEEHADSEMAVNDIESEARMMRRLNHPNIMKVLGQGKYEGKTCSRPFVVLEPLACVLTKLLPGSKESTPIWTRRAQVKMWPLRRALDVSLQLAEAMRYCHHAAIPGYALLHRDLKPDNIGFAADKRLLLFDFGLAKLLELDDDDDEPREMTPQTGSGRYMAPEVALGQPYHRPAEVFSWALIAWQLTAHQKPFTELSLERHVKEVAQGDRRPPIPSKWPVALKDLLTECWSSKPKARPTFIDVTDRLRTLLAEVDDTSSQQAAPGCLAIFNFAQRRSVTSRASSSGARNRVPPP